ncbi:uncharacterized protein ColSpa_05003 [Colletotrichum spaethianum]|uniref:Uncharacterized protein n=1 Tax=Colletotrichum spaethianum TaxID=700344 RepID=A0AA37LAE9_9PEZI|nr:uncharacterized protein ColSpa_05003 [Colletotrichum spaethianum]GKT44822.1 hypothetical protein ColSpa_05003 [Colletotrichum spaethianum]
MRFSSLLALISAAVVAAVPSPIPEDAKSYVLAGPLPYGELKTEVAKVKSDGEPNAARRLNKRICEGVYMCEDQDFSGDCYYGCYPLSKSIYPDSYWVSRISSVGPDNGGVCDFYKGTTCNVLITTWQAYKYPGGNLKAAINDNMGCFSYGLS